MTPVSIFSFLALATVFGAQLMRPSSLPRVARAAFFISIFFILFLSAYYSYHQYFFWKENPVSKFLLPPHQGIDYFISYSFFNFFLQPLISLFAAVLGFFSIKILNQNFQNRFFEPIEYYLFATALLLVGHPNWIYYLLVLFISGIIGSIVSRGKISFYYFWIPVAIIINIWSGFLMSI